MKTKRMTRVLVMVLVLAMVLSVSAFAAWNGIGGPWDTHNGTVTEAPTSSSPTIAKIDLLNSGSGWDGVDNVPVMQTVGSTTYAYVLYDGHAAGGHLVKINCTKAIEKAGQTNLYSDPEVVLWDVPVSTKSGFQLSTPLLVTGDEPDSEEDDTLYIGLTTTTALVDKNASDSVWTVTGSATASGAKLAVSSTGTVTMTTSNVEMLKNNSHRAATGVSVPAGTVMTITAKINDVVALTKDFTSDDLIDGHYYLNDVFPTAGENAVVAGSANTLSFEFSFTSLNGTAYIEYGSLFQTAASVMGFNDLSVAPDISSTTSIAEPTYSVNLNDGGQLNTPITTDGTYLYFGTWTGNKSYYQCKLDGTELKNITGTGFYWAGAAVVGNQVYFGGDSGKLYWCNTGSFGNSSVGSMDLPVASGEAAGGNVRSGIMVDGDYFYFTSQGKYLWCFKANASGAPTHQWHVALNGTSTSTPTKVGNEIFVGYYNSFNKGGVTKVVESRNTAAGTASFVSKQDIVDGTASTANNKPVQSSPVVLTNAAGEATHVYFSTNSSVGAGYCFTVSGDEVWNTSAVSGGTYALGGMASDNGYLIFGNDYNYLYIVK